MPVCTLTDDRRKKASVSGLTAVCIGRQTKETADACGLRTTMAKKATLDSLVEAVVELFGSK